MDMDTTSIKQSLIRQAFKVIEHHEPSYQDNENITTYKRKKKLRNRMRNKMAKASRRKNLRRGTYGARRKSRHKYK